MSEDLLYFITNHVDPDEMPQFIWVFTVCKNTHLEVSFIERINCKHVGLPEQSLVNQI